MTFPTKGTPVQTQFASSVTSMTVNLPASISAGDLLLAFVEVRNAGTFTKPANWQDLGSQLGGSSVGKLTAFYKIADGTEGATATWTASVGTTAIWQVIKITGWHGTTPPELASASGDYTTNPNPPSLNPTSWDVEDTLWIEVAGNTATAALTTGASANYGNYQLNYASSGGSQCSIATADRQLASASEDPAVFTAGANIRYWATFTIAIRPAGESGPTIISVTDNGSASEVLSFLNSALLSEVGLAVEVWTLYHPREYITIEELAGATDVLINESGSASDVISIIALISTTDSGSSVEVLNILNTLLVNENASASDLLSILVLISQADTATGSDTSLLTILLTISEAGLGAESISLLSQFLIADTASGNDSILLTAILALQETGSGQDLIALLNNLAVSDTSEGVEGVQKAEAGDDKTINDSGSGSDLLSLLNSFSVSDIGEAVDILNILNQLSISDIGSVNDLVNILGLIEKTDNATATESISILNSLNVSETATGADVIDLLLLLKELILSESGLGSDEVAIVASALIELTENASGQDLLYILNLISKSEAGHGIENLNILAELNITDSAVGNEFIEMLNEFSIDVFDNAEAVDIIAKYLVKIYTKRNNPYGGKSSPYSKKVFPFSQKRNIYNKKTNPFSIKN